MINTRKQVLLDYRSKQIFKRKCSVYRHFEKAIFSPKSRGFLTIAFLGKFINGTTMSHQIYRLNQNEFKKFGPIRPSVDPLFKNRTNSAVHGSLLPLLKNGPIIIH